MRFIGNRSKQWSGYVILALTLAAAWLTRNRPRYRSRFPYTNDTSYGGTTSRAPSAGRARVYDTGQARAAATATAATAGAARVYDRAEDPSPYLTRRLEPEEVDRYRNRRRGLWLLPLLLLIPLLVCGLAWLVARNGGVDNGNGNSTATNVPAAVQVDPQPAANMLAVGRVVAPQAGWVALYRTDANGQPDLNSPVGAVPVAAGEQTNVPVPLSQAVAPGEQLAAVLHADNGTTGTFEPNGADAPLTTNGSAVATTFALSAAAANTVANAATNDQASSPPQPLASSSPQVVGNTVAGAASPAASASTTGGNGISAGQNAGETAAGDATSTVDGNIGAAGAPALATDATTQELDPTTEATDEAVAAGTATDEASTATLGDETLAATADAVAVGAATKQAPEALTDATPDATDDVLPADTATTQANEVIADATPDASGDATASTASASNTATASDVVAEATPEAASESATSVSSDAATAAATAGGEVATPELPATSGNVEANAASILVAQQPTPSDSVTLDRVVAPQNGWVAITRPNADGTPNLDAVLGSVPVQAGENTNVEVPLSEPLGENDAVAVLLTDEGTAGTFEPSGSDLPVIAGGALVAANIAANEDAANSAAQTATSSATAQATSDTAATSDTVAPSDTTITEQVTATAEPAATTEAATTAATDAADATITTDATIATDQAATSTATDATAATAQAAATTAAQEATTAAATAEPTMTAEPIIAASAPATVAPTNTVEPVQTFTTASAETAATQPPLSGTATAQATATEAPATSTSSAAPSAMATVAPTATSVPVPTATSAASSGGSSATAQPTAPAAAGAQQAAQQSVVVNDPFLFGNAATIDQVTTRQNGWVVLQRIDANGQPVADAIVGVAPVQAGTTSDVQVPLGAALAPGEKVVVLLHADAGAAGTFEYPGPDTVLTGQNNAPVLTVQASAQLPDTGTLAGLWMAVLVAGLVVCAAGVVLRQHRVH